MMPPKKGSPEGMKARFAKAAMQDMGEEPEAEPMEAEGPAAELKEAMTQAYQAGMSADDMHAMVTECAGKKASV